MEDKIKAKLKELYEIRIQHQREVDACTGAIVELERLLQPEPEKKD